MQNVTSPRHDEAGIEQQLAAAPAPRVSLADLEGNIISTEIVKHVAPSGQILRWAVITTRSGFAVTGRPSASVSPENDNQDIGEAIAVENARNELWAHMGYALKQELWRASLPRMVDMTAIARMCHEVNRAYCQFLGDNSQPAWEDAPQWQRDSAMAGVELHSYNPDAGPEASHASWMEQKLREGWKWGPVKDPEKKEHHCIVPFSDLPREQQAKDWLFRGVVHAMRGAA